MRKNIIAALGLILIITLIERGILNILFFNKFGKHASNVIEIWFYYGVAKGTFLITRLDPTYWILKFTDFISSQFTYHLVILNGCLFTAITAFFIFHLVKRMYHDGEQNALNAGLLASLIYVSMVNPLNMNLASFFHDLVQLPIFVAILIINIFITNEKQTHKKLGWILTWLIFVLIGIQIGPIIMVAIFISLICLIIVLMDRLSYKIKIPSHKIYRSCIFLFIILMIFSRFTIVQGILDKIYRLALTWRGVDIYSQIRAGSKDLLPLSLGEFCKIYNVLLFFVPFGLIVAYGRKESIGITLFICGAIISSIVSRGSRILDIGIAILVSYALLNWDNRWKWFNISISLTILFIFIFKTPLKLFYGAIIGITGVLLFGFANFSFNYNWLQRKNFVYILTIISFIPVAVLNLFLIGHSMQPRTTEAEYQAYNWLKDYTKGKGRVLVTWPDGYFVEAISGLKSITSPVAILDEFNNIYWQDEKSAYQKLKEYNINYIVVTTRYFKMTTRGKIKVLPSLNFNPKRFSDFQNLKETLIFKMIYDSQSLINFNIVYQFKDIATGEAVYIYKRII